LRWARDGKLKTREDVRRGFDALPDALRQLLRGDKHGKLVLEP
jgi:NADPH-dependent curcumin reductase CurA